MTETPLIDQLNELGPAGRDLLNATRRFVDQAESELRLLERRARRELLDERVRAFLAESPDARPTVVYGAIRGFAKQDVLDSVRRLRPAVPGAQNQTEEAA